MGVQQNSLSPAEDKLTIDTFEAVNKTRDREPALVDRAAPRIDLPTLNRSRRSVPASRFTRFTYLAGPAGRRSSSEDHRRHGIHAGRLGPRRSRRSIRG